MRRFAALAIAAFLLSAAGAEARTLHLRAARGLTATVAPGPAVRLAWRDRASGEFRWEVWRGTKRRVLRANATRLTDRTVRAGATYVYRVRPCRRARCGRSRT